MQDRPPESIWKCDEAAHNASQKRTNVCRCGREGCKLPWAAHDWSYLAERDAPSGQPTVPSDDPKTSMNEEEGT